MREADGLNMMLEKPQPTKMPPMPAIWKASSRETHQFSCAAACFFALLILKPSLY
jgi:hypothetical protein